MPQDTNTVNAGGEAQSADPGWKSLYKAGGVAALIATALFLTDIIVLTTAGPAPSSALAWLTLIQEHRGAALVQLFFTDLIGVALVAPIALALYAALRRAQAAYAALATAVAFVGIALVFATNGNYSLIQLSSQYAAATSEAQRGQLLAAAEATLATGTLGTGALMASLLLEGALLTFCVLMLPGRIFGKGPGYLGILAHGLDVARSIVFLSLIPIFDAEMASGIGVPLLAVGGTLQLLWYPWVGLRLWQLGRLPGPEGTLPQSPQPQRHEGTKL